MELKPRSEGVTAVAAYAALKQYEEVFGPTKSIETREAERLTVDAGYAGRATFTDGELRHGQQKLARRRAKSRVERRTKQRARR